MIILCAANAFALDLWNYLKPSDYDWKTKSVAAVPNSRDAWSYTLIGNNMWLVKWSSPFHYSKEFFYGPSMFIREDRTCGGDCIRYFKGNLLWAKRYMSKGAYFWVTATIRQYDQQCRFNLEFKVSKRIKFFNRLMYDYGGAVGRKDSIVMQHWFNRRSEERYYYGFHYGLLRWENWQDGALKQASIKNSFSAAVRPNTSRVCQ